MVEHREGMMSLCLKGDKGDGNGYIPGDFPVHDAPPDESLAAMVFDYISRFR